MDYTPRETVLILCRITCYYVYIIRSYLCSIILYNGAYIDGRDDLYETCAIRSIPDAVWCMTNINILITLALERPPAENLIAINYPDSKKINIHFMTLYSLKRKRTHIIYI